MNTMFSFRTSLFFLLFLSITCFNAASGPGSVPGVINIPSNNGPQILAPVGENIPIQIKINRNQTYIDNKIFNSSEGKLITPFNRNFIPSLPGNNGVLPEKVVFGPELPRGFYPQPLEEKGENSPSQFNLIFDDDDGKARTGKGTTKDDVLNEKQQKEWDLQAKVDEEKRVKNRDLTMNHLAQVASVPNTGLYEKSGIALTTVYLILDEIYNNFEESGVTFAGGVVTGIPKAVAETSLFFTNNIKYGISGVKTISVSDMMSIIARKLNISDDIVHDIEIGGEHLTDTLKSGLTDISNGVYNPNKNHFIKGFDIGGEFISPIPVGTVVKVGGKVVKSLKNIDKVEVLNTIWVRPKGWRIPVTKGNWSNTPGDSNWISTKESVNTITGGNPIPFKKGYPDFTEWAQDSFEFDKLSGQQNDFSLVYGAVAKKYNLVNKAQAKKFLNDNGLTPHHHQDGKTIQLVPSALNNEIPHVGGAANIRSNN